MANGNDLLMSGGVPSFSYKGTPLGTSYTGVVDRDPEQRQITNYNTGDPEFWGDGSPKMQVVVTVKTDYTNGDHTPKKGQIQNDDGLRRFFLRWHSLDAVRKAVREAGADGLRPGGKLTLTFSATEPSSNPRFEDAKLYTAVYVPPAGAGNEALMAEPASAGSPAPQVDAAAAAALLEQLDPEQRAKLGL